MLGVNLAVGDVLLKQNSYLTVISVDRSPLRPEITGVSSAGLQRKPALRQSATRIRNVAGRKRELKRVVRGVRRDIVAGISLVGRLLELNRCDVIVSLIWLKLPVRGEPKVIYRIFQRAIQKHLRGQATFHVFCHHFDKRRIHAWTDVVFDAGGIDPDGCPHGVLRACCSMQRYRQADQRQEVAANAFHVRSFGRQCRSACRSVLSKWLAQ